MIACSSIAVQPAFTDAEGNLGDCASVIPDVTGVVRAESMDNCTTDPADLTITQLPVDGTFFGGSHGDQTTVTVTVVDEAGNSTTCDVTVELTDNEDPVVLNCPANQTLSALSTSCAAQASWNALTATDNCGVADLSYTVKDEDNNDIPVTDILGNIFGQFPLGENTVTYTATDVAGNTGECVFTITVEDNTAPVFTGCPTMDIEVTNDEGECGAVVTWQPITASDNCPGVSVTASHLSGTFFDLGTTEVTFTATDAAGLTSTCEFDVVVTDNENPTITCLVATVAAVDDGNCEYSIPDLISSAYIEVSDNCPDTDLTDVTQDPAAMTAVVGSQVVELEVTDASGNTATCEITVLAPDMLMVSAMGTDETCNEFDDGTVTTTVSGGTMPYTYSWVASMGGDLGANAATDANLTGLTAGTYDLTVTDANGCTATTQVVITQPDVLAAAITGPADVPCFGDMTASLTVNVTGGTVMMDYTYLWSTTATTATISGLGVGTYGVTVTDDNGCVTTASHTISEPTLLTATIAGSTNVSCNGFSDGAIDLSVSGGTPGMGGYTFSWTGPGMFTSTVEDPSGLSAGTYNVTVTDANMCTATATVTITEPDLLTVMLSPTHVSCNAGMDGSIATTVMGGTPGYTYSWVDADDMSMTVISTAATATGLSAGTYSVTVTDANMCTATATVTITEPPALSLSIDPTDVSCNGLSDGTATANVMGGTSGYTYSWTNSSNQVISTLATATGLGGGMYTVLVTDTNGCTISQTVTINEPAALAVSLNVMNISCNGADNGSVTATVSGGTLGMGSDYTYSWSVAGSTNSLSGLAPGTYSLTVTDDNDCEFTTTFTITEPAVLTANITASTNVSCNGESDGSATVQGVGGTPGYMYSWVDVDDMSMTVISTAATASGLSDGTYSVTVTDANGCTATTTVTITEPSAIELTFTQENVNCFDDDDGSIDLEVVGGTPNYSYSWTGPDMFTSTSQDLIGLEAGTYFVTVTDDNDCTAEIMGGITIGEPTELVASITGDMSVLCFGDETASLTASAEVAMAETGHCALHLPLEQRPGYADDQWPGSRHLYGDDYRRQWLYGYGSQDDYATNGTAGSNHCRLNQCELQWW